MGLPLSFLRNHHSRIVTCRFRDPQGAEIMSFTQHKEHKISLRRVSKTPSTIIRKRTKSDCMLESERHLQKNPDENDLLVMTSLISSRSYRQ